MLRSCLLSVLLHRWITIVDMIRREIFNVHCWKTDAFSQLEANSHRHARHDKTVLSVSRPLRRCELDSRQVKTENVIWTRSEQSFSSHRHTRHDTDRAVLLCLVWCCELGINLLQGTRSRTRSFATADGPRDALCHSESCQLLLFCSVL